MTGLRVLSAWAIIGGICGGAGCGRTELDGPARRPGRDAQADAGGSDAAESRPSSDAAVESPRADGGDAADGGGTCGPLIDDVESGTGRICEGVEKRVGVWYAYHDPMVSMVSGTQWPPLTTPGTPIETSLIPGGRGASTRAMHTYGSLPSWVGIGFDLAFDGVTYGLYDARSYDGVTFWGRGTAGSQVAFRISTAATTLTDYGGLCPAQQANCASPLSVGLTMNDEWTQYWIPFDQMPGLQRDKLTNMQFQASSSSFDFWVDDISFYVGQAGCCPAGCGAEVTFADPVLEQAVRSDLGNPAGSLPCGEVCALSGFGSVAAGIQDIAGLQCLASLVNLSVAQNQIVDVSPLAGLNRLRTLDLSQNQIVDPSPLSSLDLVATLDLQGNQIQDMSLLTGLGQLTTLNLSNNQLRFGEVRSGLTDVTSLDLSDNQMTEIRRPFVLPSLTNLVLTDNALTNVSGLVDAPQLQSIYLAGNRMSDLGSLAGLASVTWIDLSRNQVTDLSTWPTLASLTALDLSQNQIADLGPLSGLAMLASLEVSQNQITALGPLSALSTLYSLDLSENEVSDLAPLAGLSALAHLSFEHNQVTNLKPLAGHANLTEIDLADNQVRDLSPLSGLPSLRDLNASGNQIKDLSGFFGLTLTSLNLSANQITDLTPLSKITFQSSPTGRGGTYPAPVDLTGNPFDCAAQAANIKSLQAGGASVMTDCP